MISSFRPCLAVSAAALATFLAPAPAHACSNALICEPFVAPGSGYGLPANLPGFPVAEEISRPSDAGVGNFQLALLDGQGRSIALERRSLPAEPVVFNPGEPVAAAGSIFVPRAALSPGPHMLRWQSGCDPQRTIERAVTILPPAPLPTAAGSVSLSSERVPIYEVWATTSCTVGLDVALVRVAFQPAAELLPFLPVARIKVVVDGKGWSSTTYGGGPRVPRSPYFVERLPLEIFAQCGAIDAYGFDRGLDEGSHQGELQVEIPGAPGPLPGIPFTFTLSCQPSPDGGPSSSRDAMATETARDDATADLAVASDASGDLPARPDTAPVGTVTPDAGPFDAASVTPVASSPDVGSAAPEASSDGGCSCHLGTRPSNRLPWAAPGLAILLVGRARMRRRRRT